MSCLFKKITCILIMVCIGLVFSSIFNPASAKTDVGNATIASDTTWTSAGSPYIISGLTINSGITLTLEAGTILQLRQNAKISVNGHLIINGAENQYVILTSLNGTDSGWGGMDLMGTGELVCHYGQLSYGCKYDDFNCTYQPYGIRVSGNAQATISDSEIKGARMAISNTGKLIVERTKFEGQGIYSTTNATITSCTFVEAKVTVSGEAVIESSKLSCSYNTAVECLGGDISISNCEISSTTNFGVGLKCYGNLTLVNNLFTGNYYPIAFTNYSNLSLVQFQGNTIDKSSNKYNGYLLESLGSNAVINIKPIDRAYLINRLTIPQGQEVHILAGTILKFMDNGQLTVNGGLQIEGTSTNYVYLTSVRDDNVGKDDSSGGDSNNDNGTEQPGTDWANIDIKPGGQPGVQPSGYLNCVYGVISYGSLYSNSMINIEKDGVATFADSQLKSGSRSIYNRGSLTMHRCSFRGGTGLLSEGYAVFENSEFNVVGYGIYSNGGEISINRCKFTGCQPGVQIYTGKVDIVGSNFIKNYCGIQHSSSSITPYIYLNNFIGNQYAINNTPTTALDCKQNYWGHTGGPSTQSTTSGYWTSFGDKIGGDVLYDPWLTEAFDGTFQPVQISISGISEGQKTNANPVIQVNVGNGVIKSVQMDGAAWENGRVLSEGSHVFRVLAENFDHEERELIVHFSIDKTPPTALIDNGSVVRLSLTSGWVTFTANGSSDNSTIAKYQWVLKDSSGVRSSCPGTYFSNVFNKTGEYTLTLTITDDHGNESQPYETKIFVEDSAVITMTGINDKDVVQTDVTVGIQVEGGSLTEIKLDGNVMPVDQTTLLINTEEKHQLEITAATPSGALSHKNISFTIDKTPPVARLGEDRQVYVGEDVWVSSTLSYDKFGIAECRWTQAGVDYTGQLFQTKFDKPGDYTLSLMVRDPSGFWSTVPATMTLHVVYRPVDVSFDGITNNQKFNHPLEVKVNLQGGTGHIKEIKLNGQAITNGAMVDKDGEYKVEVIAANAGEEERTFTINFSVDQTSPTAFIDRSIPIQGFNDGLPIYFYPGPCTDNMGIAAYEWSFSDLSEPYHEKNISRGFNQSGEYTVKLVVIDEYGNRSQPDILTFTIQPKGSTAIDFTGAADQGRYNASVSMAVNVSEGELKHVILDGQEVLSNPIVVSADGTHTIRAEAGNTNGYILKKSITFAIDKTPPVAEAGPDVRITKGQKLTLTGKGTDLNGISEYKWVISGDEQEYIGQTLVKSDLPPGNYSASLWVKDNFGNSSQPDTVKIYVGYPAVKLTISGIEKTYYKVSPIITVKIDNPEESGGRIESMTLTNLTTAEHKSYNSGTTIDVEKEFDKFDKVEGRYGLEIVVADIENVTAKQTFYFTIDQTPPVAEAGPDRKCFNDGEPLAFDGRSSTDSVGVSKFVWTFSDGTTLSGPVVYKSFTTPGTYTVSLIVTDMAGNISEQADTCTIEVTDKGNTQINMTGLTDKGRYNQDVSFQVTPVGGTLQKLQLDNLDYPQTEGTISSDGYHTILVQAVSETGYVLTKRWTFQIDKTPPVADAGGDRRAILNQAVKFSGGFSMDNSGIDEYKWEFPGGKILMGREVEYQFAEEDQLHTENSEVAVSLWVKDTFGNWSVNPNTIKVRILDPGVLSTVHVKVTDEQDRSLTGSIVILEDANGSKIKAITDSFGEINELVETGEYKVYVYHTDYKTDVKNITVAESTMVSEQVRLAKGSDIITVTSSRQLDLNEIKALGIDTTLPENRFIFKFELKLEYVEVPIEVLSTPGVKKIDIPIGGGDDEIKLDCKTESTGDPRIMVIVIRGEASVLKEFHEMSIIIMNGADSSVTLDNTQALLNLPSGLSLAPIPEDHQVTEGNTILKQSLLVDAGSIPGQSQKKITWVLRGDEPGTYQPTINYSGTLNPFGIEIKNKTSLDSPIIITDPKLLELRAAFPDIVYVNEPFDVRLELKNNSTKPYYDAYIRVDSVQLVYAKMLSKLEDLYVHTDCLQPGEKITLSISFLPEFTGVLSSCELTRVGGNVDFSTKLVPDCPRLFTKVETDDKRVQLEWVGNPGSMTYYAVRRRKAGEEEYKIICDECYNCFYEDTQVENFVTYEYVITAIDIVGDESDFSEVIKATPGVIKDVTPQGIYNQPIQVILDPGNPNCTIYYTTDGTDPEAGKSLVYEGTIAVANSTIIKAIAVGENSTSKVFEFQYVINGTISGDFTRGVWARTPGFEKVVHLNTGDQYSIFVNKSAVCDWGAQILPPGYIREMPDGNWTVETNVTLESFVDGTGFATGLILMTDTEKVTWGYHAGANLAMETPGISVIPLISNGSTQVYLRIRKEGNLVYFEYRVNPSESWHLGGSRKIAGKLKAGVYVRTWGKPHECRAMFRQFTVQVMPGLDPAWEWQCPVSGPEYHALGNQSLTLTIPNKRTYNVSTTADYIPKLIRTDIENEDWRLNAMIQMDEHQLDSYFVGLMLYLGGKDYLFWGREGQTLVIRRAGKSPLFTLLQAPDGPVELQIQRTGPHYVFLYRAKGTVNWLTLGDTDMTTTVRGVGITALTRNTPQAVKATITQLKLEKILPKLSSEWSWYQGTPGTAYRLLGNDGIALKLKNSTYYDDSSDAHLVSRLQREAGTSDWQVEVKVTPVSGDSQNYLAGLQVIFGEKDIVTWGWDGAGSLRLDRVGETLATIESVSQPVYLCIVRTGNDYTFQYRMSESDSWIPAKTLSVAVNPLRIAAAVKSVSPTSAEVNFTGLTFNRLLPKDWQWYASVAGPTYRVQSDSSLAIQVPGSRSYLVSDTVMQAPQIRMDLAKANINGDWTITTWATLTHFDTAGKFESGLFVDFGSRQILEWGFWNGLNLKGIFTGSAFGGVTSTAKAVELRISKKGTTYSLEYRFDPNGQWELATKKTIAKTPLMVGVTTWTSVKCRVETNFSLPRLEKVIPEYQVTLNLANAKWGVEVTNASIRVDQGVPRSVGESYTTALTAGSHTITVWAPGYKTYETTINVTKDTTVNIPMEPETDTQEAAIDSVTCRTDPVTNQLVISIRITNQGTDAKLWVRISMIDDQNRTVGAFGGLVTASTGESIEMNCDDYVFKIIDHLAFIKTEILSGNEKGVVLVTGETPVL